MGDGYWVGDDGWGIWKSHDLRKMNFGQEQEDRFSKQRVLNRQVAMQQTKLFKYILGNLDSLMFVDFIFSCVVSRLLKYVAFGLFVKYLNLM